jgi:cell wall assembly regulator SMI1
MPKKASQLTKLLRHFKRTAEDKPELGIAFRPPTTLKTIRQFESEYGWEIPGEVIEMLLVFEGEDSKESFGSCLRFKFCSLEMALRTFGMAKDVSESVDPRIPHYAPHVRQDNSWNELWYPLAEIDFGCNAIYYDEHPSEHGRVGQIFMREDDHSVGGVKAIGLEDLLTTVLEFLETEPDRDDLPFFRHLPDVLGG